MEQPKIRLYLKLRWYSTELAFAIPELSCQKLAGRVTTLAEAIEIMKATAAIREDDISQKVYQALSRLRVHNRKISTQTNLIMVLHVDEEELSTMEIADESPPCENLTNKQILELGL